MPETMPDMDEAMVQGLPNLAQRSATSGVSLAQLAKDWRTFLGLGLGAAGPRAPRRAEAAEAAFRDLVPRSFARDLLPPGRQVDTRTASAPGTPVNSSSIIERVQELERPKRSQPVTAPVNQWQRVQNRNPGRPPVLGELVKFQWTTDYLIVAADAMGDGEYRCVACYQPFETQLASSTEFLRFLWTTGEIVEGPLAPELRQEYWLRYWELNDRAPRAALRAALRAAPRYRRSDGLVETTMRSPWEEIEGPLVAPQAARTPDLFQPPPTRPTPRARRLDFSEEDI